MEDSFEELKIVNKSGFELIKDRLIVKEEKNKEEGRKKRFKFVDNKPYEEVLKEAVQDVLNFSTSEFRSFSTEELRALEIELKSKSKSKLLYWMFGGISLFGALFAMSYFSQIGIFHAVAIVILLLQIFMPIGGKSYVLPLLLHSRFINKNTTSTLRDKYFVGLIYAVLILITCGGALLALYLGDTSIYFPYALILMITSTFKLWIIGSTDFWTDNAFGLIKMRMGIAFESYNPSAKCGHKPYNGKIDKRTAEFWDELTKLQKPGLLVMKSPYNKVKYLDLQNPDHIKPWKSIFSRRAVISWEECCNSYMRDFHHPYEHGAWTNTVRICECCGYYKSFIFYYD